MLTLTPDATQAIEQLLEAPEIPEGAGVRIASSSAASDSATPSPDSAAPSPDSAAPSPDSAAPSPGALQVTLAQEPELGDEVIDQAGARVFLEETVAPFLEDKLLDAEVAEEGVRFTLGDRS